MADIVHRSIPAFLPAFMMRVEAVKTEAYLDGAGVWTIGIGHTSGVHRGMTATLDEIRAWLPVDLQDAVRKLYLALTPAAIARLSDHQWGALVSFAFNEGVRTSWGLWEPINAGRLDEVPGHLEQFDKITDPHTGELVVCEGLANRRKAEIALWNTADS